MRAPATHRELGFLLSLVGAAAAAQPQIEAPLPPRIIDTDENGTENGGPGRASLAPLPPGRGEQLEEIVVVGPQAWRQADLPDLPDLGSNVAEPSATPQGRIRMSFLPLYDPESPELSPSLFDITAPAQRIGYLELFRVRFGEPPD